MLNFATFRYLFKVAFCIWLSVCSESVLSKELKFIAFNVPPWASLEDERLVGIFPDVVLEIERRTQYDILVSLAPFGFERINREMKSGRQDCTIAIIQSLMADEVVVGEKLFDHSMGVVAHKKHMLEKYSDLYDVKISAHEALTESGQFLDDKRLSVEFDSNYLTGLRKIEHGRLDAVAGAIPTILYLARMNEMGGMLGAPMLLKQEPVHLQCSKQSDVSEYIGDINRAINSIKQDGTLRSIVEKYR